MVEGSRPQDWTGLLSHLTLKSRIQHPITPIMHFQHPGPFSRCLSMVNAQTANKVLSCLMCPSPHPLLGSTQGPDQSVREERKLFGGATQRQVFPSARATGREISPWHIGQHCSDIRYNEVECISRWFWLQRSSGMQASPERIGSKVWITFMSRFKFCLAQTRVKRQKRKTRARWTASLNAFSFHLTTQHILSERLLEKGKRLSMEAQSRCDDDWLYCSYMSSHLLTTS